MPFFFLWYLLLFYELIQKNAAHDPERTAASVSYVERNNEISSSGEWTEPLDRHVAKAGWWGTEGRRRKQQCKLPGVHPTVV